MFWGCFYLSGNNSQKCAGIICLLILCAGIYFLVNIKWIVNNENIFVAHIGIFSALAGAFIGGMCSYFGSINGVEKNYKLVSDLQKKFAAEALLLQLEHSVEKVNVIREFIETDAKSGAVMPYNLESIVYDKEWYKNLSIINTLSANEKENIIIWFNWLNDIQYCAKFCGGYINVELMKMLSNKKAMDIDAVNAVIVKLQKND